MRCTNLPATVKEEDTYTLYSAAKVSNGFSVEEVKQNPMSLGRADTVNSRHSPNENSVSRSYTIVNLSQNACAAKTSMPVRDHVDRYESASY
jgi:hypothetical protein